MKTSKVLYNLSMLCVRSSFVKHYGKTTWMEFKLKSRQKFSFILHQIPSIGNSIFSSSYEFAPCYIAWYQALKDMNFTDTEVGECIWMINDRLISTLPNFLRVIAGKIYYSSFRRKASAHIIKQRSGKLHPHDWTIEYRDVSKQVFEIDIFSCGLQKLARDYDAEGMFPYVCRMDYLFANKLHCGFERNKTLGDMDNCCNCRFTIGGNCQWNPNKGFKDRK